MDHNQVSAAPSLWARVKQHLGEPFADELFQQRRAFDGQRPDSLITNRRRDVYLYILLLLAVVLAPMDVHNFLTGQYLPAISGVAVLLLLIGSIWRLHRGGEVLLPPGVLLLLTIALVFLSVIYGQNYSIYWTYPLLVALPVLLRLRWSAWLGATCALLAAPLVFLRYDSHTALIICLSMLHTWLVSAWLVYALSAQSRRLSDIAVTDPLTGAYNRRFFNYQAQQALDTWLRYQRASSLLIIDVDHFKRINDRFGHGVGDEVLQKVVALVSERVRSSDTVCRYGGEEFVVLLREASGDEAMRLAEHLRAAVEQAQLLPEGNMTISIGVCDVVAARSLDDWLKLADGALYLAKNSGRNRVEMAAEKVVPIEKAAKTMPAWR